MPAIPDSSPYERHDSLTVVTYDHLEIVRNRADVGSYVDLAFRSGGPVLELGCGTGEVLLPIARAGVDVVGIDIASPMLDRCHVKLIRESPSVRRHVELVRGDMRRFDLDRSFALAIAPFGGFMHLLTHDDQVKCLRTVVGHLAAGARVAFDVPNRRPRCFDAPGPTDWRADDGQISLADGRRIARFTRSVARDEGPQVFDFEVAFEVVEPDGRANRVIERVPLRYTPPAEIEQILGEAGLEIENLYGGFDHQPFDACRSDDVVVVARALPSGEGP
ncbi:MAG: class I SAM-dependent methyltransferase [Chloroflexi bacterium]|nr:class I SAM-dependent methyltransferase [Chloroflexota bacterium]